MSAPVEKLVSTLEARGMRGKGPSWQCPAHEDKRASLSIGAGEDGRALVKCHAGCKTADVLAALGLEEGDLFPPKDASGKRIVAEYAYTDEHGAGLFQAVRFEPKDFRQRHREVGGPWIWDLKGVRRVLYRLPELLAGIKADATVYLVEGEKDVDTIRSLGLVATCNPMGASAKWLDEYTEALRGARVVVIADKDEPGRKHAATVEASLRGKAASVCIVEVAEGKDAADWIAQGATREDFEKLQTVAEKVGDEPRVSSLAEVLGETHTETPWVVKNLLAVGAVGILSGDYYIGKSTLTTLLLTHVAAGKAFLDFEVEKPLSVLYWSAEGNRRMFAERVACSCFHSEIDATTLDFGLPPAGFVAPFDSREFAQLVVTSGAKLIACDTVGYFTNAKADENSATDWMKYVQRPLSAIAHETGASFFLTHHYSKPSETRMGRHRIRGSSAIGSDCDTVMRLEAPDGDDAPARRLFIDKVRNEEKPKTRELAFEPTKALFVLDAVAAEDTEPASRESRSKAKQAAKDEADRKAKEDVGLLFLRSPAGLTAVEIEKAFHRGRPWVADTLGEFYADGAIRRDVREQKNRRGQARSVDVWKWSEGSSEARRPQAELSPNPDNLSFAISPRTPLEPRRPQEAAVGSSGDVPEYSSAHVRTRQNTSETKRAAHAHQRSASIWNTPPTPPPRGADAVKGTTLAQGGQAAESPPGGTPSAPMPPGGAP